MKKLVRPLGTLVASLIAAAAMLLWIRRYSVSTQDVAQLASVLHWWGVPVLIVLLAVHVALAAWRWSLIEVALGASKPPFRRAFSAGAMALGFGTFLPGLITNVAARALSNRIGGGGTFRGAVSGTLDQMSDLAVVLLLVPAGLCGVATRSLAVYLIVAAASAAMTCAVPGLIPVLHRLFGSVPMRPPRREAITALLRVEVLSPIYWLSLLRVACLTAITLVIHFATGAVTVSAVVIAIPLVTVAISLAMMPGGFGVSEWSFSAVFTAMGIGHQQIVTFVLGNRILLSGSALFLMLLTATVVSAAVQPRKAKRPVRA